ncbi:MAG: hypothetical protein EOO75_12335, partial [Myxococcales bacterium]
MNRRLALVFGPPLVLVALAPSCAPTGSASRVRATPPGRSVHFLAVGDTGTGGALPRQLATTMAGWCGRVGCDFLVLLGDNIYPEGAASADDPIWATHVDEVFAPLAVPILAVLGNHDYGGNGAGFEPQRAVAQIRRSELTARWYMESHYYRLAVGDLDLVFLDTQAQLFRSDEAQRQAVAGWLSSPSPRARWTIALGHHPYFSNGTHGDA